MTKCYANTRNWKWTTTRVISHAGSSGDSNNRLLYSNGPPYATAAAVLAKYLSLITFTMQFFFCISWILPYFLLSSRRGHNKMRAIGLITSYYEIFKKNKLTHTFCALDGRSWNESNNFRSGDGFYVVSDKFLEQLWSAKKKIRTRHAHTSSRLNQSF